MAWQDHRAGNYDVYVACTDNAFVSQTLWQVTSNAADQTDPAIAIAADNTVYLVWTDLRNGSADIYGASSGNGFASNVPIVTASGNQTDPAIAVEPSGSVLHLGVGGRHHRQCGYLLRHLQRPAVQPPDGRQHR